ncbi:MAG: hypothetical protein ACOYWZ_15840 [Bacillota bacterium]
MNEELFQPSLSDGNDKETETYDIGKLFYVAFFGGIVPTVVLSSVCARGLKLKSTVINLMITAGVLVLIVNVFIAGLFVAGYITIEKTYLRWIFRIVTVLLYLGFYKIMSPKYKQHIVFGGETKPLLRDAIIWIIAGNIIQFFLFSFGGLVINNVI